MTALMREVDDATAAELDLIGADAVAAPGTTTNGAADLAETSGLAGTADAASGAPVIEVLKGGPNDVELAALVAVLTAAASAGRPRAAGAIAEENWGHPTLMHRQPTAFSPSTFAISPQLRQ